MTMTSNSGTITTDPYDDINSPPVEETPEEEAPTEELPPTEEVETPSETPPAENPELATVRAQLEQTRAALEQYAPYIQRMQQQEAQAAQQAAEAVASRIEEVSDASATPLTPEDRQELRAAIRDAIEYKQMKPAIEQNNLAGAALKYAREIVGLDGTVKQLMDTANELLAMGDPRTMAAYVSWNQKAQAGKQTQQRQEAAQERLATGVDTVSTAPSQPGSLRTLKDFENHIYKYGLNSLSPTQMQTYMQRRRDAGIN
jgi:acylphosphatase